MSVLLVGISHRSAPVAVLERVAITDTDRPKLTDKLMASGNISEVMVVSTCNRVEVYAVVDAFHGALASVGEILSEHSGLQVPELTKHAYVRSVNSRSSDRSEPPTPRRTPGRRRGAFCTSSRSRRCASASVFTPRRVSTPLVHPWCPLPSTVLLPCSTAVSVAELPSCSALVRWADCPSRTSAAPVSAA